MNNIKSLVIIFGFALLPLALIFTMAVPLKAHAAAVINVAAIGGPPTEVNCANNPSACADIKSNPIVQWLGYLINVLSVVVGVGAVIMVIVAGLQYSAARDNPQGIQAAKQKLTNVIIGLAAFIFLYAFLQWLIPGGVFNG